MTRPRSTDASFFRFCPFCAAPLERRPDAGMARAVCPACGYVQYRNPVVGVAAVIEEGETAGSVLAEVGRGATDRRVEPSQRRVLLGRRGITHRGKWCFPCGYVEFDEEVREALVREVEEETGLVVVPVNVLAVQSNFHDPDKQSVGIWFRSIRIGGTLRPGDDLDALRFVPADAPGVPLAFPTDKVVLDWIARKNRSE